MTVEKDTRDYIGIRKALDGHSLGELEAQILDIIWELDGAITTSDVYRIMYERRPLSYSTIMLTMAKLAKKNILTQERTGVHKKDAFRYTVRVGRHEMARRLMEDVSQRLLHMHLDEAVGHLIPR